MTDAPDLCATYGHTWLHTWQQGARCLRCGAPKPDDEETT